MQIIAQFWLWVFSSEPETVDRNLELGSYARERGSSYFHVENKSQSDLCLIKG